MYDVKFYMNNIIYKIWGNKSRKLFATSIMIGKEHSGRIEKPSCVKKLREQTKERKLGEFAKCPFKHSKL